jgi:hypothetical protein
MNSIVNTDMLALLDLSKYSLKNWWMGLRSTKILLWEIVMHVFKLNKVAYCFLRRQIFNQNSLGNLCILMCGVQQEQLRCPECSIISHLWMIVQVKGKDETSLKLKQYLVMIERQYGYIPKQIRIDQGEEYLTNKFHTWCADRGIIIEITAPYLPSQNGIAE